MTSLKEVEAKDELLDLLLAAKSQGELTKLVADNVLALDQKWWLRVATRNDAAMSREERERLGALANSVMRIVDAIVKNSEQDITQSSEILQRILASAADANGEWQLPLSEEAVAAMSRAMDASADRVDEALLSYAYAYLRKAHKDKIPGVVELLQRFLQLFAARALVLASPSDSGDVAMDRVIRTDPAQWRQSLPEALASEGVSETSWRTALQRRMEGLMLLKSGSYTQRVCAEFLDELRTVSEETASP